MYRGLSSRGTNLAIAQTDSSEFSDLKVSDILMPSYLNEETRRQRLKDNLNKMWQKSMETTKMSEMNSSIQSSNEQNYVSKVAELQEKRSRRRNLQTINYLESLKMRQISNTRETEYFKQDHSKNKETTAAGSQKHFGHAPIYNSPLNFIPRSRNSRVLIDKMLPSSKSYEKALLEADMIKKQRSDYEFAEIEDSIKDILKKSEKKSLTTSNILNSPKQTMKLAPSAFDKPVAFVTTTGTSMFEPNESSFPASLGIGKKIVQKRHKFIQSTPVVLTNSSCQTDPYEPFMKEASKQTTRVDIKPIFSKTIMTIKRADDDQIDANAEKFNGSLKIDDATGDRVATKTDDSFAKKYNQEESGTEITTAIEQPAAIIEDEMKSLSLKKIDTQDGEAKSEDTAAQLHPSALVKVKDDKIDSTPKKSKKDEIVLTGMPRLGPSTPVEITISRPGTRGFKSNFADMLKKKNPAIESYLDNVDSAHDSNQSQPEKFVIKSNPASRPKSSSETEKTTFSNNHQKPEEPTLDGEDSDEESDYEEIEKTESPSNNNRARTAPADIAPPKSILKKRPQLDRQTSYHSDGTGTPGYAKAYHKTKDFHIDPTLFKHFEKANNNRKLSFSGIPIKSSKPKKKQNVKIEESFDEDHEPQNISYYDQNEQRNEISVVDNTQDPYAQMGYNQNFMHQPSLHPQPYYEQVPYHPQTDRNQWYSYSYNYPYYDPYLQTQYQQYSTYNYPYPTIESHPYPYYSTHSDSQIDYYGYNQPIQEGYTDPNSNTSEKLSKISRKTSIYKPNINNNAKKPKSQDLKTFYVTPKKPPIPQYIPLSQTQPEDIKKQEHVFRPIKPRLKSHLSDNAIRVHAKDTLAKNPKGKFRRMYSTQENYLQKLSNEESLY